MASSELSSKQIKRIGKYPAPNIEGYNSLFFHPLTSGNDTDTLYDWGNELTRICNNKGIDFYYFFNDFNTKINVYPNEVIEQWWNNR